MRHALITAVFLLSSIILKAEALRCNFSSADISTKDDEHCVLAGFAARNALSDGIHLNLRTHCLVISDGDKKICLISNDMMEISPDLSKLIRDSISVESGIPFESIYMHCIHTHSSPRVGGSQALPGGTNYTYKVRTVRTIIDNAVKTITDESGFRKFDLQIGKTTCDINANRCEPDGPSDKNVYAARLVDRRGRPICAFINYSCHPVCMGPSSYLLSSDYSGVARKAVSSIWGCEVFQFTGASGNQDPKGGPEDYRKAEEYGRKLAEALASVRFETVTGTPALEKYDNVAHLPYRIPVVTEEALRKHAVQLARQYEKAFPSFADDVKGWEAQMLDEWGNPGKNYESLDFSMAALNINGILFFFTQGEPFCEYQQSVRETFPDRTLFFIAYTNGQNSYLPSRRAYEVRKGYEYEIDQMHVYIKAPYPLSEQMPQVYSEAVFKTVAAVAGAPAYSIIPNPQELAAKEGEYTLRNRMRIACAPEFEEIVSDFIQSIKSSTGIKARLSKNARRGISITKDDGLEEEGYLLSVSDRCIKIKARDVSGAFYALQTVKQLLPAQVYSDSPSKRTKWALACCEIHDYPRFHYRGMLLDCGRHFYPKEAVLSFIDNMAMHKQNYLHWHLTEDQGWRIEIKKYPRLTEVGAWRKETGDKDCDCGDGIPHGGYYSQDDIREIVEYARRRCVNIVPEIELPGHSSAAIAAYPFLSCTPDEPKEVSISWGIKNDVYSPSPETFKFLEDVFDEVLDLFPCKYYHIGGDECPRDAWRNSAYCRSLARELGLDGVDDLQYYFVKHFDSYLRQHGKTVIGWDEILDGSAVDSTVVMSYRGHTPAIKALEAGMRTILCPNRWFYYDYDQNAVKDIPFNHHLFVTLRKTYNYRPLIDKALWDSSLHNILGYQACLWGEYIPDAERLEYQAYPREAAVAEFSWTGDSRRDWHNFRLRICDEFERLEAKGINYSKAFYNVLVNMDLESDYPRDIELELDYPYASIHYTVDGTDPTPSSPLAPWAITVSRGDTLKACGFNDNGEMVGELMTRVF